MDHFDCADGRFGLFFLIMCIMVTSVLGSYLSVYEWAVISGWNFFWVNIWL